MDSYEHVVKTLQSKENKEKKEILQRFFKTGEGEYGYGDIFLGITVPETRAVAKSYQHIPLNEVLLLLKRKEHECRLCALEILIFKQKKASEAILKELFESYLQHLDYVNNWDLVDLSAPKIMGGYLKGKERSILYELAVSPVLWERRVAVITTLAFVRNGDLKDAFALCDLLLEDKEDLMRKAVGWVLRETGKKDKEQLENFLKKNIRRISRTSLRYAIERFGKEEKSYYMHL
ncbi:MAG: DNA alkylation repair protein [Bacteroidales bacterium]